MKTVQQIHYEFVPSLVDGALPPNMALQRTCRIVTRFAYAKPAPIRHAAELGC